MYRKHSSNLSCLYGFAIACCALLMPVHLYAQDASEQPLVTFNQSHPLLEKNATPMVQVFESGAVVVNRPPVNKRPGSYQLSISNQQVAKIRQLLKNSSDVETAVRAVKHEKAIASAIEPSGQRTMTLESDPTTTVIAVNQSALTAADPAAPTALGQGVQVVAIDNLSDMASLSNKPSLNSMRELEVLLLRIYNSAGK